MTKLRDTPFVDIEDGILRIFVEEGRYAWQEFSASKRGAVAAGRLLHRIGCKRWLCSSSVDFATEYGAPDIDFWQLIMDGFTAAASSKKTKCKPKRRKTK